MPFLNQTISLLGPGTTTIIPGQPGLQTVVFGMCLVANAATTFTIKSGNTSLTGAMSTTLGATIVLPVGDNIDKAWFITNPGDDFNITITGLTGNLAGWIQYVQVVINP